ncbi:Uncharacterised protein [Mycobacteroides abscessus]|nr:Uncharacterised protein [Mycobacteroides abscessus]
MGTLSSRLSAARWARTPPARRTSVSRSSSAWETSRTESADPRNSAAVRTSKGGSCGPE